MKFNFIPMTELPEYDWEKQYKETCEFIENIPDEYKSDDNGYGEFFIPKLVYVPTKMPPLMEEMYGDTTNHITKNIDKVLEDVQLSMNKILLQSVYHNYLHLIDSARSMGDKENEKDFTKKAEEILTIIKSLD